MSDIFDEFKQLEESLKEAGFTFAGNPFGRAAAEFARLRRELAEMKVRAERAEGALSENGKPAMTDREGRLVEAVSIAVKYLDALDRGQVFRPDEPTSVWGHLRSALADYADGSEHPTRPKVRAE